MDWSEDKSPRRAQARMGFVRGGRKPRVGNRRSVTKALSRREPRGWTGARTKTQGGAAASQRGSRKRKKKQGPVHSDRPLCLWKKPRRVRARRREENEIRFPRRPVRRGKHFSAEQCASWPPQADSECAHEAAALPVGKGKAFFDGLRGLSTRTGPSPF